MWCCGSQQPQKLPHLQLKLTIKAFSVRLDGHSCKETSLVHLLFSLRWQQAEAFEKTLETYKIFKHNEVRKKTCHEPFHSSLVWMKVYILSFTRLHFLLYLYADGWASKSNKKVEEIHKMRSEEEMRKECECFLWPYVDRRQPALTLYKNMWEFAVFPRVGKQWRLQSCQIYKTPRTVLPDTVPYHR